MADFSCYVAMAVSQNLQQFVLAAQYVDTGRWAVPPDNLISPRPGIRFQLEDPPRPCGSNGQVCIKATSTERVRRHPPRLRRALAQPNW